jgi:hypothetical protein
MGDVAPCILQGCRTNMPEGNDVELESTRKGNVYIYIRVTTVYAQVTLLGLL